jgi:hypothetical protein
MKRMKKIHRFIFVATCQLPGANFVFRINRELLATSQLYQQQLDALFTCCLVS